MQGNGPLRLPGAGDTQTPAFKGSAWAIYMSRPIKGHVDGLGLSRLMHNQPAAETQRNSHTTSGGLLQREVDQSQRIHVSVEHATRSRMDGGLSEPLIRRCRTPGCLVCWA